MIRRAVARLIGTHRPAALWYAAWPLLTVAAALYGAALWGRGLGYRWRLCRAERLPCLVVSVGNLTWGGTGKTPLVEWLARGLRARGRRVAVLTRGYRGADEGQLLRVQLPEVPVLVGPDRVQNGRLALTRHGVDTLLLDDGFQHWRLARDVDLVAISATAPFGIGGLLPRGTRREPLRALHRAQVVCVTKAGVDGVDATLARRVAALAPQAVQVACRYEVRGVSELRTGDPIDRRTLAGQPVCALSGIGDPDAFHQTVRELGARLVWTAAFADHHAYAVRDLVRVAERCQRAGAGVVVTTEKDAMRLRDLPVPAPLAALRILVVAIEVQMVGGEGAFWQVIERAAGGVRGPLSASTRGGGSG